MILVLIFLLLLVMVWAIITNQAKREKVFSQLIIREILPGKDYLSGLGSLSSESYQRDQQRRIYGQLAQLMEAQQNTTEKKAEGIKDVTPKHKLEN